MLKIIFKNLYLSKYISYFTGLDKYFVSLKNCIKKFEACLNINNPFVFHVSNLNLFD